jgi:hypothetical protein
MTLADQFCDPDLRQETAKWLPFRNFILEILRAELGWVLSNSK